MCTLRNPCDYLWIDKSKKDRKGDQLFPPDYVKCFLKGIIDLVQGENYKKNDKESEYWQSIDGNKVQPVPVSPCERSVKISYLNIIALHTIATNDFFVMYATAIELNVIWYAIYAGIRGIKNVREKKETHTWAIQVLDELVDDRNPHVYK